MPKSCSVINCSNRYVKWKRIPFFTLPTVEDLRLKWLAFIDRKKETLPKEVYVCDNHFITGKISNDKINPDFVPSVQASSKNDNNNNNFRTLPTINIKISLKIVSFIFCFKTNIEAQNNYGC